MKHFLVIWYDECLRMIASQFIDSPRIFFAQDDAMKRVIERDSKLWEKIAHETQFIEIRELLHNES